MDFWRLFRLISAKKWLIAAIVLLTGLVVFVGTALQSLNKEYEAEALMQPQDPAAANAEATANGDAATNNNNQDPNQLRIANISELLILLRSSSDLSNRAAALVKLNSDDRSKKVFDILRKNGYFAQIDEDVESQADQLVRQGDLTAAKEPAWIIDQKTKSRNELANSLALPGDDSSRFVTPDANASDVVDNIRRVVSFESVEGPFSNDTNPQVVNQIKIIGKSAKSAEAELYANMVSVAFLDYYTNRSEGAVSARIELLQEKLTTARAEYNKARDAAVAYQRQSPSAAHSTAATTSITNVQSYENSLNTARQELAGFDASVTRLQALVAASPATRTVPLPADENPQVRSLESRVADLRIAFSRVQQSNYDVGSDVYKQAKGELDQAIAELATEKAKQFSTSTPNLDRYSLEEQLDQALVKRDDAMNRVTELTKQLGDQQATLKTLPVAAAKMSDLEGEASIRQDAVRRLEKALADQELQRIESGHAAAVNIVSPARAQLVEGMSMGQRVKVVAYGMIIALVFGILGIVALDALDNAVKTAGDAQRLLDLTVIGQIPTHVSDLMRGPKIVALDPLSPAAEAYRLLRTDLMFLSNDQSFKSLLVTPIRPGQGATTTAGNLAIALAQSRKRVILVDADLRRPKLHAIFNVSNTSGLSSVLAGTDDYASALLPTDVDNLMLLPAGPPVMNPSELIGSGAMVALMRRLREGVDFVIIDAPSPVAFSDSAVLAASADATLLVLRAGQAPDGAAEKQVQNRLEKAHANVIGMVLNDIEPERLLSARHHMAYYPPMLADGATSSPQPIAALPKPQDIPHDEPTDDILDEDEDLTPPAEPAPAPVRKPRIVATRPTKAASEANGNAESSSNGSAGSSSNGRAKITTQTPLVILFATSISTAVGLLTLALSRAGR